MFHPLQHDLGTRRIHWRYDDPSGVPDLPSRISGTPIRKAGEFRVRVRKLTTPKAA